MTDKVRAYLRKIYGRRYMAFPADQVEMVEHFIWLNDKHGLRYN